MGYRDEMEDGYSPVASRKWEVLQRELLLLHFAIIFLSEQHNVFSKRPTTTRAPSDASEITAWLTVCFAHYVRWLTTGF
jgi:hypothetical protein